MDGKRDELADFANFLCQCESSIKRDQCQIVISATFSQQIKELDRNRSQGMEGLLDCSQTRRKERSSGGCSNLGGGMNSW